MYRRGMFSSLAWGLAAAAAFAAAPAEARDRVFWSVDVAAPGVATSVSNYPAPAAYYPAPSVVGYPAPVVTYPAPVIYAPPPVVYRPRPVFLAPAPVVVYRPWYGHRWGHGHGHDGWDGHGSHGHRH